MRQHPWSVKFAEDVTTIIKSFGFPDARILPSNLDGVEWTCGNLKFGAMENPADGDSTIFWTEDVSDMWERIPGHPEARIISEHYPSDLDMSYRGEITAWELSRKFLNYAVSTFAEYAAKKSAHSGRVV